MIAPKIPQSFGRSAFGGDPAGYDAARPAYPEWIFDFLCERCGLVSDMVTFEIGAGTGTATHQILCKGASPLVAVEPDERLAAFLREKIRNPELEVIVAPFEQASLPDASFDLGISATSFHWLDEEFALSKVAKLLRPGGWWAMFWNVFGDSSLPDPFHEATKDLLGPPSNPSAGDGRVPFALDADARIDALERTNAFHNIAHRTSTWPLFLNPDQTAALYGTYSNVNIRPDREEILSELHRIAQDDFQGRVTRNMVTSLYVAQRRS